MDENVAHRRAPRLQPRHVRVCGDFEARTSYAEAFRRAMVALIDSGECAGAPALLGAVPNWSSAKVLTVGVMSCCFS